MNSTSPSTRLDSIAARSPARSSAGPEVSRMRRAQLGGDDHRQAGLAQPGRPGQQHVVGRVAAPRAPLQHQLSCSRTRGWPTNSRERARPQGGLDLGVLRLRGRRQLAHRVASLRSVNRFADGLVTPCRLACRSPVAAQRGERGAQQRCWRRRPSAAASAASTACLGLLGREAQPDQRLHHLVAARAAPLRGRGAGARWTAGAPTLSLQLQHQPLGALAARCRAPGSAS